MVVRKNEVRKTVRAKLATVAAAELVPGQMLLAGFLSSGVGLNGTKSCTAVCKQSVRHYETTQTKKPAIVSVAGFLYAIRLIWGG